MTEARTCRVCDVRGMVHLDRDPADGPTVNPLVECPKCGRQWIATGTQWLGSPPVDATEEEFLAWCAAFAQQILDDANRDARGPQSGAQQPRA